MDIRKVVGVDMDDAEEQGEHPIQPYFVPEDEPEDQEAEDGEACPQTARP